METDGLLFSQRDLGVSVSEFTEVESLARIYYAPVSKSTDQSLFMRFLFCYEISSFGTPM